MTVPKGLESVLNINPQIMHGSLCFKGTRIPVTVFLDNLAEGMGMEEFLTEYPTITREQAREVLIALQSFKPGEVKVFSNRIGRK